MISKLTLTQQTFTVNVYPEQDGEDYIQMFREYCVASPHLVEDINNPFAGNYFEASTCSVSTVLYLKDGEWVSDTVYLVLHGCTQQDRWVSNDHDLSANVDVAEAKLAKLGLPRELFSIYYEIQEKARIGGWW